MRPEEQHEPHQPLLLLLGPLQLDEELGSGHNVDYEDDEKATKSGKEPAEN